MYFETIEEFNRFTDNGTQIIAGELYFIKDTQMMVKTNNIDGNMQVYTISGNCSTDKLKELIEGSITTIDIPEGTTTIKNSCFMSCPDLVSVIIPDTVTTIENNVFQGCANLTSVNIPDSITTIKNYAFNGCSSLTSIVIPNSVTSIGAAAFNDCSSLTSITVEATTPPTLGYSVFDNTNNCPIYVPAESVSVYKGAQYWDNYRNRIQAITE